MSNRLLYLFIISMITGLGSCSFPGKKNKAPTQAEVSEVSKKSKQKAAEVNQDAGATTKVKQTGADQPSKKASALPLQPTEDDKVVDSAEDLADNEADNEKEQSDSADVLAGSSETTENIAASDSASAEQPSNDDRLDIAFVVLPYEEADNFIELEVGSSSSESGEPDSSHSLGGDNETAVVTETADDTTRVIEQVVAVDPQEQLGPLSIVPQDHLAGFSYQAGEGTQCGKIYPDMRAVGTPIFQKLMSLDRSTITNQTAYEVAVHTETMLRNMMASEQRPIHPLAFFATIKHFESSSHISGWGWEDFGFFGHLCTSGVCSGYFQVDVGLEHEWSLSGVCGKGGLDLLGMKGGPDFCAALFWWLKGDSGRKCTRLVSGQTNPCRDAGYVWDVKVFERAFLVYGQANQWSDYGIYDTWGRAYSGGWVGGRYFRGYENCATSYHQDSLAPDDLVRKSVTDFAFKIGVVPDWMNFFESPDISQASMILP